MNADVVKTSLAVKSNNHSPMVSRQARWGGDIPSPLAVNVDNVEAVVEKRCSSAPGQAS